VSSLAADLVNTRPRPADPEEKLSGPTRSSTLLPPYGLDRAPAEELRRVREELLPAFSAADMAAAGRVLNPLLARGGRCGCFRARPVGRCARHRGAHAGRRVAVAAATELACWPRSAGSTGSASAPPTTVRPSSPTPPRAATAATARARARRA
jgi:hypothetical protein